MPTARERKLTFLGAAFWLGWLGLVVLGSPPAARLAAAPPAWEWTVTEVVHHGQPCWRIAGPSVTYLFDRAGGGFASLLDADGNDWISWRPGGRSAGEFRGIPNCGPCFHPGYDNAVCELRQPAPQQVIIDCRTKDGRFAGRWELFPLHATFSLLRAEDSFWFLYEGTPGGQLDLHRSQMVRSPGIVSGLDEIWSEDLPGPEWVFFTDPQRRRALWFYHHEDDDHVDQYWPMEGNMTVLGFGRQYRSLTRHLTAVPARFSLGLCETSESEQVLRAIQAAIPSFPLPRPSTSPSPRPQPPASPSPSQPSPSPSSQPQPSRVPEPLSSDPLRNAALSEVPTHRLTVTAPAEADAARLQAYARHALTHPGDPARGRALFHQTEVTHCLDCHRVDGEGGTVGPDLSHIGGKFGRPHLIESLLEPSRQIVEGYRTTLVRAADGRVLTGIVRSRGEQHWTLVDQSGQTHAIPVGQIEAHCDSPQSLMPEGLSRLLSAEQLTDLVAYLETLRPGGKATPGSSTAGPIRLPGGFVVRTLATGLTGCTAMEVLPDGDVLVAEQTGTLRLVQDGRLVERPVATFPVDSTWERGLIGVTVAPDFPRLPSLYVCYVAREPYPHHRISRLHLEGPPWVARDETVLLEGDDQRQLGGKVPAGHQGGALHFSRDGKLYVAIGEQTAESPAQRLNTLQGKILRLNPDGSIPADNPFVDRTQGKYRAIWALGLRNPFTFAVHPTTGALWINDVGGQYEEVNIGVAGGNYGWPVVDHGLTHPPPFIGPVHTYPQASIAGGDFCPKTFAWPAEWRGKYFFADFVHGWIRTLDPDRPAEARPFAEGLRRPVDLRFDPQGDRLLVLLRDAWVIDRYFQPGTGALLEIRYQP